MSLAERLAARRQAETARAEADEWLRIRDVARLTGLTEACLYSRCYDGRMDFARKRRTATGRLAWMIHRSDLTKVSRVHGSTVRSFAAEGPDTLGQMARELRGRTRMTVRDFGALLGQGSPSWWSNIEGGFANISIRYVPEIVDKLDLSASEELLLYRAMAERGQRMWEEYRAGERRGNPVVSPTSNRVLGRPKEETHGTHRAAKAGDDSVRERRRADDRAA